MRRTESFSAARKRLDPCFKLRQRRGDANHCAVEPVRAWLTSIVANADPVAASASAKNLSPRRNSGEVIAAFAGPVHIWITVLNFDHQDSAVTLRSAVCLRPHREADDPDPRFS